VEKELAGRIKRMSYTATCRSISRCVWRGGGGDFENGGEGSVLSRFWIVRKWEKRGGPYGKIRRDEAGTVDNDRQTNFQET